MFTHPRTGFDIGDPYINPLDKRPSPSEARAFFDSLILSASGWRGVFGSSDDDMGESITAAKAYAAARMASVFAGFLTETIQKPILALGIDSRPTGPAIADVMARVFLARGLELRYAFISAAPEIMAWTRRAGALETGNPDRLDAFCYISASHNPPGHNGVKFGMTDGGVLPASVTKRLIATLKDGACESHDIDAMAELVESVPAQTVAALYSACGAAKRRAISEYTLFAREVTGASADMPTQEQELGELEAAIGLRGAGVVAEMNGSARCLSIDEDFLSGLGVSALMLNAEPRRFAHRIVPEGESLEPCRLALQEARTSDPSFCLGYVPDCDGDRGNIVYWNDDEGEARALEAQDTFSLAVLAELASMSSRAIRRGEMPARMAVACNDATSLRIDAIARAFGADVFRSETGEANVVGLARSLREQGFLVRVLGEGSNGGVITHPAGVRDPLNTISAILKLLYLRDTDEAPGPFHLWLERSGQGSSYRDDFSLADVLTSLPRFTTTSVFEDRAALRVRSTDHTALKNAYEAIFKTRWPEMARKLEPVYGRLSWKAFASSGLWERKLTGPFGNSGSGGLKISLFNETGDNVAFLWMRGSGTEPVFRIMADVRGEDLESILLDFHATIVREADTLA
ncbi:MAG: hypothetical protein RBT62_06095 [Spirochaetia bacterium]|jgi:phosphoglucomutase|nr:hypothetical protein [Spirochaetia bacterium]